MDDLGIQGTKKNVVAFNMVPPQKAVYYGASDAMNTLALYFYLKEKLDEMDPTKKGGPWFIYRVEKRCLFVTMEMERNLVKIDKEYLIGVNADIEERMSKLIKEIFSIVGHEFDINSTQQLGVILFDELKLPYPAKAIKTKTGHYQTNSEILEMVSTKNPIVNLILTYRGYVKIRSTYLHNWLINTDENNEAKFQMNQVQADTGRFSGSGGKGLYADGYCGVNCQNIPTYDKSDPHAVNLRRAMVAHHGFKMVSIDYSGEELRIATNFSREPKWIQEFLHGTGDLHTITGQIITGKTVLTKKERGMGKTLNFLTMYGGGAVWSAALSSGDAATTYSNIQTIMAGRGVTLPDPS
jgi:DNA polymerase-1